MNKLCVLAYQPSLEHHQVVDLNVSSVQNVHWTRRVLTKNVSILVREFVVQTLNVTFEIIVQSVLATVVIQEIRSADVI